MGGRLLDPFELDSVRARDSLLLFLYDAAKNRVGNFMH